MTSRPPMLPDVRAGAPGAAKARRVGDLLLVLGGNGVQRAADARGAILPLDALHKKPEHASRWRVSASEVRGRRVCAYFSGSGVS
eukprot:CAMPEP_0180207668 /NCGR_PEP_ID=MMETSP0987-20121128/10289_1 /TAXON_ID=697907 /ORGANISM="non described non described, Strain CCMP2293" /LENGTH=84 /DNA_ID=CAMNT_0022163683 /DNA_START=382 /DNA_END=634 /DNA_ORIENTATION=-